MSYTDLLNFELPVSVEGLSLPLLPLHLHLQLLQSLQLLFVNSGRVRKFVSLRNLVYFTVCQIWSISLSARSGLFHCLSDLVYFTLCQIWSISLSARSGLFRCLPDLVYFTVCQIWSVSLSAMHALAYFTQYHSNR